MAGSAVDDFAAFLDSIGLMPGHIAPDGKWHRCRTKDKERRKNGSWKLQPHLGMGWGYNFATMDGPATWRPEGRSTLPVFDIQKFRAAKREARERMLAAIDGARGYWHQCKPLRGGHEYLTSHGLDMTGCDGLRVDREGWMVVPMTKRGDLVSVQRISPGGQKLFWPGAPTGGTHYNLDRRTAVLNVVCEGLATGLAIFAAVPTVRVRVCFSAHNLLLASGGLKGLTVVASDNDHATAERIGKNPGIEAATRAAEALGCGVAIPTCAGSDWADYRREHIAERTSKRLPHERDSAIQRAVDAEIAREITRNARFLT